MMDPKRATRSIAAITAVLLLGTLLACGEEESGPQFDQTAGANLVENEGGTAIWFLGRISRQLDFDAAGENFFDPMAAPGMPMPLAAQGCAIESRGTIDGTYYHFADQNENGIPDDWSFKFVCATVDSTDPANVVTRSSRYEYSVKEDPAALFGYTFARSSRSKEVPQQGVAIGNETRVSATVKLQPDGGTLTTTMKNTNWNDDEGEYTENVTGHHWDVTFDPDSPIALGSPLPSGDLDFGGRRYFWQTGFSAFSFTLETLEPLHYNAECEIGPRFDSGILRGRLNGKEGAPEYVITFSACGDTDVQVNNASE